MQGAALAAVEARPIKKDARSVDNTGVGAFVVTVNAECAAGAIWVVCGLEELEVGRREHCCVRLHLHCFTLTSWTITEVGTERAAALV